VRLAARGPRTRVVRVEDDPGDPDRVIVTDRAGNRASMTVKSCTAVCVLTDDVQLFTIRIGWGPL
jgi:hypothetical protein